MCNFVHCKFGKFVFKAIQKCCWLEKLIRAKMKTHSSEMVDIFKWDSKRPQTRWVTYSSEIIKFREVRLSLAWARGHVTHAKSFFLFTLIELSLKHKFVHLYKIRYEQFFHRARGYKTQSYWEKKSIPLLLWAILKRKKKVIYPLTLWSQRECLRVCSNYIVIFLVRFKAKESSRKLLRVLEVLVLADEEFVKEISLGRFYGYSGRKATRVL